MGWTQYSEPSVRPHSGRISLPYYCLLLTPTRAWKDVLSLASDVVLTPRSDFFDLGGDIVDMGLVALTLQDKGRGGYAVELEDLLRWPTFGAQQALLRERRVWE